MTGGVSPYLNSFKLPSEPESSGLRGVVAEAWPRTAY